MLVKPITVAELIALLQKYPQDLPVAITMYSEYTLLEEDNLRIKQCCVPRSDGWVALQRPDKPTQSYLVID